MSEPSEPYDLIVIGTGPGGYVCAIRAAQLGLKVAVVEKRQTHGGTCLNVGCIPSKAMLHASELFEAAGNGFAQMGIDVTPKLNLAKMLAHKDAGVNGNTAGVAYLLKKNKIDVYHGTGTIKSADEVLITKTTTKTDADTKAANGKDVPEILTTKAIVIATGSDVTPLPGVKIDEQKIVSSTGALSFSQVPKKLIVVGAGVIGLELGSVWRRLGAEVTVVEYLDQILPGLDVGVAKQAQRLMKKQGMAFKLSHKVTNISQDASGCTVAIAPASGDGKPLGLFADIVLVAIGRRPYTDGLGLEDAGIKLDNKRRVQVDKDFQTNITGVYAIGDVIKGPMLAHKAEDEGVAVAEILSGQAGHVNYEVIPSVIYTSPEIASVGASEEVLTEAGITYQVGKFPFTANGRAKVNHATDGFVKVLADAKTDRILGVHIIGANASEMIAEAAVIMEFGGSSEDLARICHAHPTLTEAVKEAAMAVEKRAIHM